MNDYDGPLRRAARNLRRRIACRADNEPPMCFVANAKWLRQEIPPNGTLERRAAHASAINVWMIIETMRVNRRIVRDVKGPP